MPPSWKSSVRRCPWRPCSRPITCSGGTSRPACCPTPPRTTSASWSTARWRTACSAGTCGPARPSRTATGAPTVTSSPASRSRGTWRPSPGWSNWPAMTSAPRSAGSPWPGHWPAPGCTSPSSGPATPVMSTTRSPLPTCTSTTRCSAGSTPSCGRPYRWPARHRKVSEEHAMTDMRLNGSPVPAPDQEAGPRPRVAVLGTGTMGSAMGPQPAPGRPAG